jgi:cell wall assembly regulator SMI1
MRDAWNRIETWLRQHAPAVLRGLRPGADESALRALERELGVLLPADLRASLAIHDGEADEAVHAFCAVELLSTARIGDEWRAWKDLLDTGKLGHGGGRSDPGVRPDWWNPRWIPITYNGCGDHHCVDVDPGPGGRSGQIVMVWHDNAVRPLVAPSFAGLLETYATDLERGRYRVDGDGDIVPEDD